MRAVLLPAALCVLLLPAACADPVVMGVDAAGGVADGAVPEMAPPDEGVGPDAASCDLRRVGGAHRDGFRVGVFCDDLQLCAADQRAAEAVQAAAPGFRCTPAAGAPGRCASPMAYQCAWIRPGNRGFIDQAAVDRICAVLDLPTSSVDQIWCSIYL